MPTFVFTSSELFRLESTPQISVISQFQNGYSFLSKPVCTKPKRPYIIFISNNQILNGFLTLFHYSSGLSWCVPKSLLGVHSPPGNPLLWPCARTRLTFVKFDFVSDSHFSFFSCRTPRSKTALSSLEVTLVSPFFINQFYFYQIISPTYIRLIQWFSPWLQGINTY